MPTPPREHGTVHLRRRLRARPASCPPRPTCGAPPRCSTPASGSRCWSAPGALRRHRRGVAVAELLGAGVAKALLGKAALPDDLPFVTGSIGLLGTRPSWELMTGCDTLLMVGSSFPYSEFLPEEGQARGVQIDIDARMLGLRYPMEVNLVGDARRDAARAAAAARAQGGPLLARADRGERRASGGRCSRRAR